MVKRSMQQKLLRCKKCCEKCLKAAVQDSPFYFAIISRSKVHSKFFSLKDQLPIPKIIMGISVLRCFANPFYSRFYCYADSRQKSNQGVAGNGCNPPRRTGFQWRLLELVCPKADTFFTKKLRRKMITHCKINHP